MGKENPRFPSGITRKEFLAMLGGFLLVGCQRPKPEEPELFAMPTPRLVPTYTPTPKVTPEAFSSAESLFEVDWCDILVVEDYHPNYDIDISEIKRLLKDNGVTCPYLIEIELVPGPLRVKLTKAGLEFVSGHVKCFKDSCFVKIAPNEIEVADTPGHDFSVFKTLKEIDRPNWLTAHDTAHVILFLKGLSMNDELWCDQFANENYDKYELVVEEGK